MHHLHHLVCDCDHRPNYGGFLMTTHELAICLYIGKGRIAPWHAYATIGQSRLEYLFCALTFAGVPVEKYRHIPFATILEQGA